MKNHEKKDILVALGKRVRELRKKAGFTNFEKFSYTFDINRVQYGRYENGGDLMFSTLMRIIQAHDMTISEFFEGFEETIDDSEKK